MFTLSKNIIHGGTPKSTCIGFIVTPSNYTTFIKVFIKWSIGYSVAWRYSRELLPKWLPVVKN